MESKEIHGILRPLCDDIQEQISYNRDERDLWNSKVRKLLDERNELNRQVKELITEVQNQKALRDDANQIVRELKGVRVERTEIMREIRTNFREKIAEKGAEEAKEEKHNKTRSPGRIQAEIDRLEKKYNEGQFLGKKEREFVTKMKKLHQELRDAKEKKLDGGIKDLKIQLRDAEKKQEDAHKKVKRAVIGAQEAHDLMLKLSSEVDRLREKADTSQAEVRRSKREADQAHQSYIVSLRCLHSIQDILRAMQGTATGETQRGARGEVQDLMSKLMSGDTLSTEELMQLQRFD